MLDNMEKLTYHWYTNRGQVNASNRIYIFIKSFINKQTYKKLKNGISILWNALPSIAVAIIAYFQLKTSQNQNEIINKQTVILDQQIRIMHNEESISERQLTDTKEYNELQIDLIKEQIKFSSAQIKSRNDALARFIANDVINVISITIGVAEGVARNIEKKNFDQSAEWFSIIYAPTTNIVELNELGYLTSEVVGKYIKYKDILSACEKYRLAYLEAIQNRSQNLKVLYFTYLIGLDAVVKNGIQLIKALAKEYKLKEFPLIPAYKKDINLNELLKIVSEANSNLGNNLH